MAYLYIFKYNVLKYISISLNIMARVGTSLVMLWNGDLLFNNTNVFENNGGLNCFFPHTRLFWGLWYCISHLKTCPVLGERILLSYSTRQDQKCKPEIELNCKTIDGFFLLVVASSRVYRPTNLVCRNCAHSFSVGKFLLSPFPLPLIDSEYHGQNWQFTSRASEWGFTTRQH